MALRHCVFQVDINLADFQGWRKDWVVRLVLVIFVVYIPPRFLCTLSYCITWPGMVFTLDISIYISW
jgi:hypothetical protein